VLGYFPEKLMSQQHHTIPNQEIITTADPDNNVPGETLNVESEHLRNSYLGQIGQFIQPVMAPLGFDWKMISAFWQAFRPREIIVSTMGVLYQAATKQKPIHPGQAQIRTIRFGPLIGNRYLPCQLLWHFSPLS
jgi:ferrous iron transport protein B